MPVLYIVATPIGNLEDITLRAIRILNEVGLVAAEDTRRTRLLLNAHGIRTRLTSYHEHNKTTKIGYLLDYLRSGDLALVSEAGMPGVSDPGYELVRAATQQGIRVVPIPGPSAVITALVASTLPASRFTYLGFLPKKKTDRIRFLRSIADEKGTIVAFESPHRLPGSLADMAQVLGNRRIAVARELTKIHEEVFRGTIEQAIEYFQQPRGEFTLVIEGRKEEAQKSSLTPEIENEVRSLLDKGIATKEVVARLSATSGLSRKELYQACLRLKSSMGL